MYIEYDNIDDYAAKVDNAYRVGNFELVRFMFTTFIDEETTYEGGFEFSMIMQSILNSLCTRDYDRGEYVIRRGFDVNYVKDICNSIQERISKSDIADRHLVDIYACLAYAWRTLGDMDKYNKYKKMAFDSADRIIKQEPFEAMSYMRKVNICNQLSDDEDIGKQMLNKASQLLATDEDKEEYSTYCEGCYHTYRLWKIRG